MNGITGTTMPYFKRELESEKIWDVGNYVAHYFISQSDANTEPRGIDASYEPETQIEVHEHGPAGMEGDDHSSGEGDHGEMEQHGQSQAHKPEKKEEHAKTPHKD
jgi:hypothetical protein